MQHLESLRPLTRIVREEQEQDQSPGRKHVLLNMKLKNNLLRIDKSLKNTKKKRFEKHRMYTREAFVTKNTPFLAIRQQMKGPPALYGHASEA